MTPLRLAPVCGAAIVALALVLFAVLVPGCATGKPIVAGAVPTKLDKETERQREARIRAAIATDLDYCLESTKRVSMSRVGVPLGWLCDCVEDAEGACLRHGLPSRCYADGWADADRDMFALAGCEARERGTP